MPSLKYSNQTFEFTRESLKTFEYMKVQLVNKYRRIIQNMLTKKLLKQEAPQYNGLVRPFTLLVDIQSLWSKHLQFSASLISYSLLTARNSKAKIKLYQSGSCQDGLTWKITKQRSHHATTIFLPSFYFLQYQIPGSKFEHFRK